MQIINGRIAGRIEERLIPLLLNNKLHEAVTETDMLCRQLHAAIPENTRISYGIVFIIRSLAEYLYGRLREDDFPMFSVSSALLERAPNFKVKSVSLCMLSFYGLQHFKVVLTYFEQAAADENWEVREMAQMFFRKIIKGHPQPIHTFLEKLVKSDDVNIRRFVAETLRPVQENKWFYKEPEYPLTILRQLFKEKAPYPRTAVGNNLSDLARRLPELVYSLIKALVACGDKNAYWIAYRACRNLVKKEPLKVMDILQTDIYKYKKRVHRRSDYQRN